jgi:hypothetical protein
MSYIESNVRRTVWLLWCGSLPQRISRPTTNFWSTGRAKQALANQRGPRQCQRPLGRTPLVTADKDADHIALVSQSELLLLRDSIWSTHGNSNPPSINASACRSTAGSQSSSYWTRRSAVIHARQLNAAGAAPAFIRNWRGCLCKFRNRYPKVSWEWRGRS